MGGTCQEAIMGESFESLAPNRDRRASVILVLVAAPRLTRPPEAGPESERILLVLTSPRILYHLEVEDRAS